MDERNAGWVDRAVAGYERVWLVLSHEAGHDPAGLVKGRLESLFGKGECERYVDVEVWRFGS